MTTSKIIITVLTLLLIGLASLTWFTFIKAQQFYMQLNGTRLDPLGTQFTEFAAPAPPSGDKVVVFFGDSRAEGWPAPTVPGFTFINRGIGGQTSTQIVQRFDEHVRPLQPDIILLQFCINDLKTIPLFPEAKDKIIANCQQNLDQIVTWAHEIDAEVILTTIFPTGKVPLARRPYWSAEVDTAVTAVNTHIHTHAADNTHILDSYALLVNDSGKINPDFARDQLHLNEAGYQHLNDALTALPIFK